MKKGGLVNIYFGCIASQNTAHKPLTGGMAAKTIVGRLCRHITRDKFVTGQGEYEYGQKDQIRKILSLDRYHS